MTKVMDGVKNGIYTAKFADAGLESLATCAVELNHSHEMVRAAN